ncbi:MAG: serine/threonine protein kinase [Planctomycetes bacterium]|jgi:serine/threonine protein kinase|nr:serine/threonine protein kinase [Planctomycetota bacterium]
MPSKIISTLKSESFTWNKRPFLRAEVPKGDNRGKIFTVAQPLAQRYEIVNFFASGGMGLLLEGRDIRTQCRVLIKTSLFYDVIPYARVRDQDGFTNQLRLPRKTLEMERRILVLLRNAGCNAVPHPNDFVYDANPQLEGPYTTEDRKEWRYADQDMLDSEPYLVMEAVEGKSLEQLLEEAPGHRLPVARSLRMMSQVAEVLHVLHQPKQMKAGMTWQLIYQDLKPANLLVSSQDRVTVIDLGGCQLLNLEANQKLLGGAATAGYCPPEIEQPYNLLTPAADVYTVGANLFQLVTGKSPVEFLPPAIGVNQARSAQFDFKHLNGACPPPLKDLIVRCLDLDPAKRFPDAHSLQEAMNGILRAM